MKHLIGRTDSCFTDVAVLLIILLCDLSGRSRGVVLHSESDLGQSNSLLQRDRNFPWVDLDIDTETAEIGSPLSRDRRAANDTIGGKSVWEKIEEFYSDKNNMAMFCVLPILILIYGGCSSIYCIHKCRQYIKGRKHKRLKEQDCDSLDTSKSETHTDITGNLSLDDRNRPVSHISTAWTDFQIDTSDRGWSVPTEGKPLGSSSYSPLPWQVASTDDDAVAPPQVQNGHREGASCVSELDDILQTDGVADTGKRVSMLSNEQYKNSRSRADSASLDFTKQTPHYPASGPNVPVRGTDPRHFEKTRSHVNLADYTTKSTSLKAADYSRFSDCRSIEIIPLSVDPNLSIFYPPHNKTLREGKGNPCDRTRIPRLAGASRHDIKAAPEVSVLDFKKDLLAKYDAMSTVNSHIREKSPRKPVNKKLIFITE